MQVMVYLTSKLAKVEVWGTREESLEAAPEKKQILNQYHILGLSQGLATDGSTPTRQRKGQSFSGVGKG